MLEWQVGVQQDWTVKPGAYGKGLKKHVEPEIWAELERTYVGAGTEGNWQALFQTIEVFRRVAVEVAMGSGFAYPYDLDRWMELYLRKIYAAPKG